MNSRARARTRTVSTCVYVCGVWRRVNTHRRTFSCDCVCGAGWIGTRALVLNLSEKAGDDFSALNKIPNLGVKKERKKRSVCL